MEQWFYLPRVQNFMLLWLTISISTVLIAGDGWQSNLIPKNYNKEDVPLDNGNAAVVNCSFLIWSISSIDVGNMDYEVDLYLWIEWMDPRLEIPEDKKNIREDIKTDEAQKLWIPPLTFRNCKNCRVMTFDAEQHKITIERGKLGFYMRHTKKFACAFNLAYYPFDIQKCRIEIESFVDKIDKLKLIHDGSTYQIKGDVPLPELKVKDVYDTPCFHSPGEEIVYGCISIGFTMERLISYHVMQTFAPSILFVVLSWLSFWLEPTMAPARVGLGLSSLLTLVTQFMNALRELPATSYMKALDVWMFACLLNVFASLVEFTCSNVYYRKYQAQKVKPMSGRGYVFKVSSQIPDIKPKKKWWKPNPQNKIDDIAKIVFPVCFGLFTLLYWCICPNLA